jgi:hypothetical protein
VDPPRRASRKCYVAAGLVQEQPRWRRRGSRCPDRYLLESSFVRIGRVEDLGEVLTRHPVHHAVMDLADHREATALESLHDPGFPQGLRVVEGLRHDPRRELLQLLVAARPRQARVAHVVVQIELGIVDRGSAEYGEERPPWPRGRLRHRSRRRASRADPTRRSGWRRREAGSTASRARGTRCPSRSVVRNAVGSCRAPLSSD